MNLGKNKRQKMLLPEVTKLSKLLLLLTAPNSASERLFSAMKRIKTYLKSTTMWKSIEPCMLLYVHRKKSDQFNMIEIAKEFVGGNQARLRTFGRL